MTTLDEQLDMHRELLGLADSIFGRFTEPVLDVQSTSIGFDPALWGALHESGLTLMSTPASAGGSGASLAESAIVVASGAAHAAPAPIVETELLGAWLLDAAGLEIPSGPLAAAVAVDPETSRFCAVLPGVGWVDVADGLVLLMGDRVAYIPAERLAVVPGLDLAGQPRSAVSFDVALSDIETGPAPDDHVAAFHRRGALGRSIQICGASTTALSIALAHAGTRQQFGRPLGKFQSVQTLLSDAAGALSMAQAATDIAVRTADQYGFGSSEAEFSIAAAKIQSCAAATLVSRNSHQVLGAIGFTLDHRLRHFTSRALTWRNQFGGRREWARRLGRVTLDDSRSGLWEFVTGHVTYSPEN